MSPELLNLQAALHLLSRVEQALRNAGVDPLDPEVKNFTQLVPKEGTMVMLRFIAAGMNYYHHALHIGKFKISWGISFETQHPDSYEVRFTVSTEFDDCEVGLSLHHLPTSTTWTAGTNLDDGVVNAEGRLLYGFAIDAEPMLVNDDKALNLIFKIALAVVTHAKKTAPAEPTPP